MGGQSHFYLTENIAVPFVFSSLTPAVAARSAAVDIKMGKFTGRDTHRRTNSWIITNSFDCFYD